MYRILLITMIAFLFGGCASSSKLLQRGNYDAAIQKSVRKLLKNPNDHEEILVLERAYNIANEQNNERIRFLKREGNIRNNPEILHLYNLMKNRQTLARTVLPLYLPDRVIQFPYIDYDEEIIAAQAGAAEYHYNKALQLMGRQEKEAFRLAWENLMLVKEYAGDYKDVNQLAYEARNKGISRVLVTADNRTHLNLAPEFVEQLLTIDPRGLDNEWVEFYYKDLDESIVFDYYVDINLMSIIVSPNELVDKDRIVKKSIEDGFEYLLDGRGNVMKDSLGNDIKIPKYKDVFCTVIETHQRKSVNIDGTLDIVSEQPRRLLKREPVSAFTVFEHISARAIGDLRALDEETLLLVETEPLPYPSDVDMIFRTAGVLRTAIAEAIKKNKNFIR